MKQNTVFPLFLLLLVLNACNRMQGNSFVPAIPEYEGNQRQMTMLKRPLREISGIDFIDNNTLAAVNDEAGKLFFVNPDNGKYTVEEFGKKGDYEDLVKAGDSYYILLSNGTIVQVSADGKRQEAIYSYDFGKHMEFESICYDKTAQQLLLICKQCGKNPNSINAYRFNLATKQYIPGTSFSIPWSEIRAMAKDNSIECKPSAAAINPRNGKLYIIASLGKVLLECSPGGKLEAVYGLNPDHFPQPEGITFSPEGDLYIANEGMQGKATLLKYSYRR